MRLLICAGGTGGGVYPALAVLQAVRNQAEVLWVGGESGMEAALVSREDIPFRSIPAAGVHGVGLRALPGNVWTLLRGVLASRRILREFRPDVLFFTGGYVAVPMALAGIGLPSLLYVPDIEPALALRVLAGFARRIAVTAEESTRYFTRRARLLLTGYPVRANLAAWNKSDARRRLQLSDDLPVLLVLGGSKGARSINEALWKVLPALLEQVQVVHITGERDWPDFEARLKGSRLPQLARYHAHPYLYEEMGAALTAADLVVSRAGASILGEYPLFGLPAVLVPYPHAWRYQKTNAEHLMRRGAALVLDDQALDEQLLPTLSELLASPPTLASMVVAMQGLSHPQAASRIGAELMALARERR